jgi:hypothetical protein
MLELCMNGTEMRVLLLPPLSAYTALASRCGSDTDDNSYVGEHG